MIIASVAKVSGQRKVELLMKGADQWKIDF